MTSKYTFFKLIDQLPRREGMGWTCELIDVEGNLMGEGGQPLTEKVELWSRDPVECVKELIGNPAFRDMMAYAPERVYLDDRGKERVIDEMWTADWWWQMQVSWSFRYHKRTVINDPNMNRMYWGGVRLCAQLY